MRPYRSVLSGFMEAMHDWEIRCAEREHQCDGGTMDYKFAAAIGIDEYMQIFQRYCSAHAIARDYFFTEPPDYDPVGEVIISEREKGPDLVEIGTQQTYSHKKKHVFIIRLENAEWRIAERKILLDNNQVLDTSL